MNEEQGVMRMQRKNIEELEK